MKKLFAASVNFVLADPPYNVCCVRDKENPDQDIFFSAEMKQLRSFAVRMYGLERIHKPSPAHYSSDNGTAYFPRKSRCDWELISTVLTLKERKWRRRIREKSISLYFKSAVATYNRSPAACTSQHTNVAENAIHFWHMQSSPERFLFHLNYQDHGKVHATFPCWTIDMNHISLAPAEERFLDIDDETSVRSLPLCPEQKSVVWKDDIQFFTFP